MHRIEVAGTTLILTAQRAAVWPARRTLLVADAHFGKAASFCARGVPVPEETTQANLDALDALVAAHGVTRIVFLGDFMHAREAHAPATLASLRRWRAHHHALHLVLIAGNHDAHAGAPPADLAFECVEAPFLDGPFALCHHPAPVMDKYVLAGHLHPAYRLSGRNDAVPCPASGSARPSVCCRPSATSPAHASSARKPAIASTSPPGTACTASLDGALPE